MRIINKHGYYDLFLQCTTKIMRIKIELIRIVSIHTECALTAIRFESAFSQSTSIGGLKQWGIIFGPDQKQTGPD